MAAAPSYQVRMTMRIMLRTGLRVSECLSLQPADLRLNQDPPIVSLRPDVPGNKAKRGREVPVPADLVESLADLKSFHRRERNRTLFDISRQWVSKSMKEAAVAAGLDPARGTSPRPQLTYGRNAVLRGVPTPVLPVLVGPPVPGGDRAVRPIGRRTPLLGGTVVGNRHLYPRLPQSPTAQCPDS